jgi:hypothetical protein
MGGGNMNKALSDFVKTNYPKSKADLMACFMEAGISSLKPKGFLGMINQHSWMFLSSYEKLREHLIQTIRFDTMLHLGSRTFPEIGGEVVQNTAFTFCNDKNDTLGSYIRLIDYDKSFLKSGKTIEAIENKNCGWIYTASQNDFKKISGSPIGYWVSANALQIFSDNKSLGSVSPPSAGLQTGDNTRFLRFHYEVDRKKIGKDKKFVNYNKAGGNRNWYGLDDNVILWENDAEILKKNGKAVFRNSDKYFHKSISWGLISTGRLNTRIYSEQFIFDNGAPSLITESNLEYLLGLLNSKVAAYFLSVINPTLNFQVGNISGIPLKIGLENKISQDVKLLVENYKSEWTSRENSWGFEQNELIRIKGEDLEEAYDSYCHYWRNKFSELHKNEEELNRQFIDIYGLQDELTPDVPLEDITILKEETIIKEGALIFRESEIMAQFISYAVGCMFGRYSLDKPGLILANQGETLETYLENLNASNSKLKTPEDLTFVPDDDNVIPVLDNEWFEDDIVNRFYAFLKATFGKPNFDKNLAFVEDAVGDIRKYFLKTFYIDHVKRYKKRPIYWLFSSPSGAFNALIYMHRYTPDTLNTMLNGYLKEYREKLQAQSTQLDHVKNVGTDREKVTAEKEQARINKVLIELQEYDRELFKIATARISIDLDDGVLVNYNKFGNVIKSVSGLNDKKAKDKVKKFDWIDVTEIQ